MAIGTQSVQAVQQATNSLPIVMLASDPVGNHLVTSLPERGDHRAILRVVLDQQNPQSGRHKNRLAAAEVREVLGDDVEVVAVGMERREPDLGPLLAVVADVVIAGDVRHALLTEDPDEPARQGRLAGRCASAVRPFPEPRRSGA